MLRVSVGQNPKAQPESCQEGSGEAGMGGGDERSVLCFELQLVFNFCIKKKISFVSFFPPKHSDCEIKKKKKRHCLN